MKIVVCGNYGAKNLGDEMILEGLLTTLKSIHPNAEVTVLSGNPEETLEKSSEKFSSEIHRKYPEKSSTTGFQIKSLPKFPAGLRSILKSIFTSSKYSIAPYSNATEADKTNKISTDEAVKNCDYFILGGGGLFGSLTFKANLIWAIQALKAYKYGKPVIMYGQSISPIRWKFVRGLIKKIFEKATLITVRDEASKEELKKLGVTKEIHVIPDLAFRIENSQRVSLPAGQAGPVILSKTSKTSAQSISSLQSQDVCSVQQKPTLIVALRQMPNLTRHFQQTIAEFLDWLITDHNYQIKFINFQEGPEEDNKLHQKVAALIKNQKHIQILKNIPNTDELLHYFSESDFVLGMRLHAIITAIKTATPFIAVNYSPKVKNFLKTAKLTDNLLELETINFENLKSTFERIKKNKTAVSENLQKFNQQSSKNHLEFEKNILQNLDFLNFSANI